MIQNLFTRVVQSSGCIYVALAVCLALTILRGWVVFKRAQSWRRVDRWLLALIPSCLLVFLGEITYRIMGSVYNEHSWIRLQKAFVLAMTKTLYYPLDAGPALATIYGPVSTLVYWPATFFDNPLIIMPVAQFIALSFAYLPALWLHLGNQTRSRQDFGFGLLTFLCFASITVRLTGLRTGIFIVHADAPTLGLGALACAFIYFRSKNSGHRSLFLAALFSVLAVWSKQVAVPLIPALALYLFLSEDGRALRLYLIYVLATGLAVTGLFLWYFDAGNMMFHMFIIPGNHPYKDSGLGVIVKPFFRITREWLLMMAWGIFSFVPHLMKQSHAATFKQWLARNRWMLFAFVGVMMMPISILSNIKVGGSNNTISHTNFFMLLATTLAFLTPRQEDANQVYPGKLLSPKLAVIIWAAIMLCVNLPFLAYRIDKLSKSDNFALNAYLEAQENPGRTYYPRLTLIHILAEGKIYHTIDGLMDRDWAGFTVSEKHLRAHIPEHAQRIVFHGENHIRLLSKLPEFSVQTSPGPDMPDAVIYERAPQ